MFQAESVIKVDIRMVYGVSISVYFTYSNWELPEKHHGN